MSAYNSKFGGALMKIIFYSTIAISVVEVDRQQPQPMKLHVCNSSYVHVDNYICLYPFLIVHTCNVFAHTQVHEGIAPLVLSFTRHSSVKIITVYIAHTFN